MKLFIFPFWAILIFSSCVMEESTVESDLLKGKGVAEEDNQNLPNGIVDNELVITYVFPNENSSAITVNEKLFTLQFNKPVKMGLGILYLVDADTKSIVDDVLTSSLDATIGAGGDVRFELPLTLLPEKNYQIYLSQGAFLTLDDQLSPAIVDETWKFSTTFVDVDFAMQDVDPMSVNEGAAFSQVDYNDVTTGLDENTEGESASYSCFVDFVHDSSVAGTTPCTSVVGLSFNSTTGVFNWTPNGSQAGDYELKILGVAGDEVDTSILQLTVIDTNQSPNLNSIADQAVSENSALATIDANDGVNDFDIDSQALVYTCYYDTLVNNTVASTTACTQANLGGVFSFNTSTGVMDWTPDFLGNNNGDGSGRYEFRITADDQQGSPNSLDSEIFVITVNNTNRTPVLDAIGNQTVAENSAITQVNTADGGDDQDVDLDNLTYTCTVDSAASCVALGVSFNTSTGVLDWTPGYTNAGTHNFTITGSDGVLSDNESFTVTVTNVNRAYASKFH